MTIVINEDFEKYMRDSKDYYDNREPMTERKLYQLWKDGAEFGYNKANEWNFIKDGKFPTENIECLCIVRPKKEKDEPFENKDFRAVLFYRNGKFYLEENDDDDGLLQETDFDFTDLVVAWKEIVLPKMDDWYVTMNAIGRHEIRRECPKNVMYKGTYEECEKWIERKNLNLFTMFRKAILRFSDH